MILKNINNEGKRLCFSIRKSRFGTISIVIGSFYLIAGGNSAFANEKVFVDAKIIGEHLDNEGEKVGKEDNVSSALNKTELMHLIKEIDGKFVRGVYSTKTEDSIRYLKSALENARITLDRATSQEELKKEYSKLIKATVQLKTKKGEKQLIPEVDTTKGKTTIGKKADNTEKVSESNSIVNSGSKDKRNGKIIDKSTAFRISSTGGIGKVSDDPYVSFSFSKQDDIGDSKSHSSIKFFDKTGDNGRNNASISYGEDNHGKFMRWESSQPRGGGFRLEIDKELSGEYTIGVKFSFDKTTGSWRKIIDYKNSESDNGFYFYNGGHLQFYPNGTISKKAIKDNEVVNFIIVRSTTEFAVYLVKDDGTREKEFSLTDSTTLENSKPYIKDGKTLLGFFFDDMRTGSEATPGGENI